MHIIVIQAFSVGDLHLVGMIIGGVVKMGAIFTIHIFFLTKNVSIWWMSLYNIHFEVCICVAR